MNLEQFSKDFVLQQLKFAGFDQTNQSILEMNDYNFFSKSREFYIRKMFKDRKFLKYQKRNEKIPFPIVCSNNNNHLTESHVDKITNIKKHCCEVCTKQNAKSSIEKYCLICDRSFSRKTSPSHHFKNSYCVSKQKSLGILTEKDIHDFLQLAKRIHQMSSPSFPFPELSTNEFFKQTPKIDSFNQRQRFSDENRLIDPYYDDNKKKKQKKRITPKIIHLNKHLRSKIFTQMSKNLKNTLIESLGDCNCGQIECCCQNDNYEETVEMLFKSSPFQKQFPKVFPHFF